MLNSLFDNVSRIGNDSSDLTNRNIQNTQANNYMLENYTLYSPVNNALDLATRQPNVLLNGFGGRINADNIDDNTALTLTELTNPRGKTYEQERLFQTVPYLGKGLGNSDIELQLTAGDLNSNKKSADPNSEVSHINYSYYPLIPSIEATVSNPENIVQGVAYEGWVRGGMSSRTLHRESLN